MCIHNDEKYPGLQVVAKEQSSLTKACSRLACLMCGVQLSRRGHKSDLDNVYSESIDWFHWYECLKPISLRVLKSLTKPRL